MLLIASRFERNRMPLRIKRSYTPSVYEFLQIKEAAESEAELSFPVRHWLGIKFQC
jgi:hypothetical protein